MQYDEAKKYLDSFQNYELDLSQVQQNSFKIERVKDLLGLLGNPQNNYKVIHVAGSKGKGSICALTSSILKEADFSVGLYTSPHLYSFHERFRVLDKKNQSVAEGECLFDDQIREVEICEALDELKPIVEEYCLKEKIDRLTLFEVFTLLALLYFRNKNVDFAVLETGLGGRLDATNAVDSLVAAIASISLEHTSILGDNVSDIAKEKAAIIKDGSKAVVISRQESLVQEIFEARCKKLRIDPLLVGKEFTHEIIDLKIGSQKVDLHSKEGQYPGIELCLAGGHQIENVETSIGIIESLNKLDVKINSDAIYEGIRKCFWPGRFEIVSDTPMVILDGAHNDDSCSRLVKTFKSTLGKTKVCLVLGFSQDKNIKSICEQLSKISKKVIFTKADHPRSASMKQKDLQQYFEGQECFVSENMKEAMRLVGKSISSEDIVLVAGSLFVVSEARNIILNEGIF